jgi:hypothetical protein
MSFLDLTRIRSAIPDKEHVWRAVENWIEQHPERTVVPVIELLADLGRDVNTVELLDAIDALVASGIAKRSYRVIDPSQKILLTDSYDDRADIPEEVLNNWNDWIKVQPKDVAMVLESV